MRTKLLWYLLILGILCVTARRSNRKGFKRSHKKPLYRSVDHITTSEDEVLPKLSPKTKLIVIKARSNEANNEGRFFKHFLLLKQFMEPQQQNNNGYNHYPNNNYPNHNHYPNNNYPNNYGGIPYIIINNPTNLTNVNNNTVTNTPAPAAAAAAAAAAPVRYAYLSNSEALPYALPMPTQVYQQRQQAVPQVVYGLPINAANFNQPSRNRNRNENGNGNPIGNEYYDVRPSNPFSTFTNNLKRITFI